MNYKNLLIINKNLIFLIKGTYRNNPVRPLHCAEQAGLHLIVLRCRLPLLRFSYLGKSSFLADSLKRLLNIDVFVALPFELAPTLAAYFARFSLVP